MVLVDPQGPEDAQTDVLGYLSSRPGSAARGSRPRAADPAPRSPGHAWGVVVARIQMQEFDSLRLLLKLMKCSFSWPMHALFGPSRPS